jgi:signal peptidase II
MFGFVIISAGLLIIDLIAKKLAYVYLGMGRQIVLVPNVLHLSYVENTGAAFGLLRGMSWILVAVAIFVCLYIVYMINADKCKSRWQYWGFIFLFAGAAGNLINRLFLGYVIDFLTLPYWPTFNFADIFINIGVGCLLIYYLRTK